MKLSGNTILITGGTSGLGLALAEEFLKLGNTVIICGRRTERLESIKAEYPAIITKACDVSLSEGRRELYEWIGTNYTNTNVLINNAGMQLHTDLTHEVNLDKIHEEIETNLVAPIHLSSLFAEHLASKKDAAIINISSGLAFAPLAWMPVYCATKAAIHSYTMSLRHQLRNTSIKVFEIIPTSTDTELGHQNRADKSQSHGGMPISGFIEETMEFLKNDVLMGAVGNSKGMVEKRDGLFAIMNK